MSHSHERLSLSRRCLYLLRPECTFLCDFTTALSDALSAPIPAYLYVNLEGDTTMPPKRRMPGR